LVKRDKNAEIVASVCYKRPDAAAKEIEELFKVLQMAAKGEVLLMEDFNYPGINWVTHESNNHGQAFRDSVMDIFFNSTCAGTY
jgi:hypothetical protein